MAHGRHSNLPPSIAHSLNAEILSSDQISCSEVPEQPSWSNYPGLPAEAGHYADPAGGVQNNSVIDSVLTQQIPGSVRAPNESDRIIAHSLIAEILSSDLISCSEVPEQPSWSSYSGLPAEAGHSTDPAGGVQNNNVIDSVPRQQIPGSVRAPNESDDGDEWLRYLGNGTLDDIIATDIPADNLQMAGSVPVSPSPNSETWQHMVHLSVSVPSTSQQLNPTISPPTTTNVHSAKRTKVRMQWTVEMHDRFIDAVNQLGGSENAKPKAIHEIMKVEGLTRDQVKSHLQKYKLAQVKHQSSEGTSVETTMPSEAVSSDVQINIEALALQVRMEIQKKLHEMVEMTRRDLVEIHRTMLQKYVMDLQELEKRRKLCTDRTAPPLSARCSGGVHGDGSSTVASDAEVHASEAGSHGDNAGA